jgi:hypothetical protein
VGSELGGIEVSMGAVGGGEETVLTGMLFISESAWARAPAIHVPSTHNDDSAEAHMLAGLCGGSVVLERPPKKQKIKEMKNAQMNSNEVRPGIMNEGGRVVYKKEQS